MAADLRPSISTLGRGPGGSHDLDREAARALFAALLDGEAGDLETGAILVGLRAKGETLAEMLGFLDALDTRCARLPLAPDLPRPVVLPSYNGARRHANLTPLLALLLARYGVPVLVHGADAGGLADDDETTGHVATDAFGRVTSAQVFAELGIAPCRSIGEIEARLAHASVAYAPLELLAPGLARLVALRERLGLRSLAHAAAKFIAPYRGRAVRVVGVTHPEVAGRMREVFAAVGADAMLLDGTEGEPYANPLRCPRIEMYRHGVLVRTVDAEEGAGGAPPPLPASRDAATTAAWIGSALAGTQPIPAPLLQQIGLLLEASREPPREDDAR